MSDYRYVDVFVMDAVHAILLEDFVDCLDDAAFAEAIQLRAAYLAGLSAE
jgi:hypothetical protein